MTRSCSIFRILLAAVSFAALLSPLRAQKLDGRIVQPLDSNWTLLDSFAQSLQVPNCP
jgi:hypothetical protein